MRVALGVASAVALLASLAGAGPAAYASPRASTVITSVAAQARAVHNMAEFAAASPQVQRYIDTPARGAYRAVRVSPTVEGVRAAPDANTGWAPLPYAGCWQWSVYYTEYDILGWALFTIGFNNVNDCWTGNRLLYPVGAVRYFNVHWGYGYCGVGDEFNGWVAQNWGWQNSGVFLMSVGPSPEPSVGPG